MRKLPEYLFVSHGGDLFDTRTPGWFSLPPLRASYAGGRRQIENTRHLKACLRDIGETFGYTAYYLTDDGGALCEKCVRDNFRLVCESINTTARDGWGVVGATLTDADSYLPEDQGGGVMCDNCNEYIAEPNEDNRV